MKRKAMVKSSEEEVATLTPEQMQRFGHSSHSISILTEAKRLQLKQRKRSEELIKAARLRGDLKR